jgi:hypothetical protein
MNQTEEQAAAARTPSAGAPDPWQVLGTLMEAIAAGKGREDEAGQAAEGWISRLSPESQKVYQDWLDYYAQHFADRRYPRAQALLNTPEVMRVLPAQYLYGTSVLLQYDPLEVRIVHLLDSSRFLYFQTMPEWSLAQRQAFADPEKRRALTSWQRTRTESEISDELRQLKSKYHNFADGSAPTKTAVPQEEAVTISSSGSLREFLGCWIEKIEAEAAKSRPEEPGAAAFVDFSLLDLFDLAYLLQLRRQVTELRDFVRASSDAAPSNGTFCRILDPGTPDFELLCPPLTRDGLVGRIITFPVACQGFGERLSGTDDVLFVGFLGGAPGAALPAAPARVPEGASGRSSELPGLDQLRAIASLITSTSLNELRRIQVLNEARHSAVATVMGRNLSHNIGSHVLHWVARRYEDLLAADPKDSGTIPALVTSLRRSVPFLHYMRERMDYIATVTRSPAWWSYSSPLSALIGPMSPEARPAKDRAPELALLLDNIGRSDGVHEMNVSADGAWKKFTLLNVALPHGAVGRQAFFTILENIARNCAKHQPGAKKRTLKVAAISDEDYPSLVKIIVDDGVTEAKGVSFDNMAKAVHAGIVDRRGRPVMRQLGFKEMRICAAFLRMIDPAHADDLHQPDLFALESRGGRAVHVFYMLKASDLLFVTAAARERRPQWQRLEDLGIGMMPPDEEVLRAQLRYRFIVFLDEGESEAANRAWIRTTFGAAAASLRPLPVRSFRVESLPDRQEGCTIGPDQAARLRQLIEQAGNDQGSGEAAGLELKKTIYDLWLHHNFGDRRRVQITVFGAGRSWVGGCAGAAVTDQNLFDNKNTGRITTEDLAASLPPGTDFNPKGYTAVFAHHGLAPRLKNVLANPEVVFAQGWSSSSATGSFLEQVPEPSASRWLIRELREAALSRILIIDERLAPDNEQLRQEQAYAGIVLIGQELVKLVRREGDRGGKDVLRLRIDWPAGVKSVTKAGGRFQYATVHYGLIEKCAKKLQREVEWCAPAILDRLHEIAAVVLVHSGRGRPDLQAGVRYLDFSSLESLLNEDKRALVIGLGGI